VTGAGRDVGGHHGPTIGRRYVGAAAGSLVCGLAITLVFSFDTAVPRPDLLALIAGLIATGVAGVVAATVGVGASLLIDRVVGGRRLPSLVVHALVGAALGAAVAPLLLASSRALPLGAVLGLLTATVAIVVARRPGPRR
jgi:hypothetical protein